MKNIKIMKAIAVLSVTLVCGFWGSVSVAGTCTGTSGVSSGTECLKEVTSFKLKVYEFGLCTDYPTVADRSKCTELFKNTTGFDLAISKNASLPLGGSVSLTEGTYTHAYIIVDKYTHLKSVHEFSADRKDMAGNTGKFCYSNGIVRTEDANLELTNVVVTCGATDASAANKETIKFDDDASPNPGYRNFSIVDLGGGATSVGYTKLFTLTAAGAAGTAWATDHSILAGQRITPVTISTTTKGLNIAFTVTDNVSFNFIADGDKVPSNTGADCAAGSGKYCISDVGWNGMQFLVTSN